MKTRTDNRSARRVRAQGLYLVAKNAEYAYARALLRILRGVHATVLDEMKPFLSHVTWRQDAGHTAWKKKMDELDRRIQKGLAKETGKAFDVVAGKVSRANFRAVKELLGAAPRDVRVAEVIARVRDENIRLVENAGRDYARQVREVFDDPANFGLRVEELTSKLLERGGVSESRAELIARDQTLKLNAGLNEIRQTNAGVERYTWSTSHDERVRPSHAELDGQQFPWAQPPLIDGEPLNPGEDIQCRCVALPVLDLEDS